jgi:SAM-dependent methyltransferase
MSEWFEDESFWIETYPYVFPEERFETAQEQVEKVLSLINFEGTSVLDLCCGPGRHSLTLAEKGFAVTGVDRTAFLLDKAKERAKAKNLQIDWIQQDMRDFARPGEYDLVLCMFNSFGYFDNKDEDIKVLNNIFQSLKPGGACIIDVMGKEHLANNIQPTTSEELPDGCVVILRHEIFDDWSRVRNEWILIKNGRARSFKFHHTIYSGQELKALLIQVGFKAVKLFGNLDGEEYGSDAQKLIAFARKEGRH